MSWYDDILFLNKKGHWPVPMPEWVVKQAEHYQVSTGSAILITWGLEQEVKMLRDKLQSIEESDQQYKT